MFHPIFLATLTATLTSAQSDNTLSHRLQAILSHAHSDPLYTYPTDLTQGIIPKALHSHNDYWRPLPFYSALAVGAVSVEADVWLYNDTLYVGHEESALTNERTFDALYVQPILDVLEKMNPDSPFLTEGKTKNGVFDTDAGQTLYLYVDVKTDGEATFPYVVRGLEPLRSAGYLTTWDGKTVTSAPVTVIGTGNTPLSQIQGKADRDYFYDAPIPYLSTTFSNITSNVALTANWDFSAVFGEVRNQTFNATQMQTLEEQVATAHGKGILVRYWDLPAWPVGTRNSVWRMLWDAGVDLLNVDDLEGAAGFWEGMG